MDNVNTTNPHAVDNSTSTTTKVNIFHAAEENDEEAVKFFATKKGVRMSDTNYDDNTAAHIAAKSGNLEIIKTILDRDPSIISATNAEGDTMLFLAVEKGQLNVVKFLVEEHKVDIMEKNYRVFGCTAIHIAAQFGQLAILKYFVEERNGDVNIRNKVQETPAILAAENKHHHIIKYLAEEANADLTTVDKEKNNILFMMVKKDDLVLMKYLLDERKINLDVNWRNFFGATLIHQGAILNRVNIITYLVEEKKADVDIPDNMNVTPLHSAAVRNHYETCKYLIEHGANFTSKDYRDMYPIQYASDRRLIQYMKEVMRKRERRSVSSKSLTFFSTYSKTQQTPLPIKRIQRIAANLFSSNPMDLLCERTFSSFSFCYLQSFLVVAQMIVRGSRNSVFHLDSGSPEEIIMNKMDPIAIDAVQTIPHFPKLSRSYSSFNIEE